MSHEKEAAEEKAKVLLQEREHHLRCIRIIEERLAKLSRERGLSIQLPQAQISLTVGRGHATCGKRQLSDRV